MIKARLRNMTEIGRDDWEVDDAIWDELQNVAKTKQVVELTFATGQGEGSYWDVTLPSGAVVAAVSIYHLDIVR